MLERYNYYKWYAKVDPTSSYGRTMGLTVKGADDLFDWDLELYTGVGDGSIYCTNVLIVQNIKKMNMLYFGHELLFMSNCRVERNKWG